MSNLTEWWKITLVLLLISAWEDPSKVTVNADIEDVIGTWADNFGEELWQLSQSVTKLSEIKQRYSYKNHTMTVKAKDGKELLHDIIQNVETMMKYKTDAIKCIMQTVEDEAAAFENENRTQNFTYYSSKCSAIEGEELDPEKCRNANFYAQMSLERMKKYFSVPVNLNYSAVQVPTNLYDRAHRVLDAIEWSDKLDDVFLSNYQSDPALQWQYFGSSSGFLRNFPAMEWKDDPDLFDCRMRPWYIEAATCSKDVVILLDTTGSMRGMRMRIAKLTVDNILDTLTNNDFVNVFNFSDTIQELVPCFEDMLVQATPENVKALKSAVNWTTPEGHANFSVAFTKAFELLAKYREMRGCGENSTGEVQCNQAIMLVTDGVPHNITEVFEEYNWMENGTQIPVRIFTYLIGREVFQVKEIQLIACLNRGFYKHVHSLNEVREGVFTYVPVLARPLVLQGDVHPVTWTAIYSDTTDPTLNEWLFDVMDDQPDQTTRLRKFDKKKELYFSQSAADRVYTKEWKKEPEVLDPIERQREYHLMITVSIPAFDTKAGTANYTHVADLLGVVGTDILVDHIKSLTLPYRIGVNGYAFIVSNNGHVILHPDLRPVSQFTLKDNFNSVDLTDVEFLEDDECPDDDDEDDDHHQTCLDNDEEEEEFQDPRNITSRASLALRRAMVNHTEGEMLKVRVKSHYDEMRRVSIEERDYFYAPIKGTPFSLGLSLPHKKNGLFETHVTENLIKYTQWETPVINLFKGYDWKVRPDWVYCKYHFETKDTQSIDGAEKELRHFLTKMASPDWHWLPQYSPENSDTESVNCDRTPIDNDEYYCQRDLLQLLVYDAKVTSQGFDSSIPWEYKDDDERDLLDRYNATVRFISTQSGLTRWQYMLESDELLYRGREFGNLHKLAIDEPWYKAAVLQHEVDPHSFVYSVAADRIGVLDESAFVTGSYAIFRRDAGKEVPVSVVGLQFRQSSLAKQFLELTSKSKCPDCSEECDSEELDCFVLDSGGYVLISENDNDTGLFYGTVEASVMEGLVNNGFYKQVIMYDLQALCFEERLRDKGAAVSMFTPVQHLHWLIQWLVGEMTWLLVHTNLQQLWQLWPYASGGSLKSVLEDADIEEYDSIEDTKKEEEVVPAMNTTETDGETEETEDYETINHPCDKEITLYTLDHEKLKTLSKDQMKVDGNDCWRPFHVRPIPHSNLLLVVIDALHYGDCNNYLTTEPVEMPVNDSSFACDKIYLNRLPRRRLDGCFTQHPGEESIKECGDRGSQAHTSIVGLLIGALLFVANFARHT